MKKYYYLLGIILILLGGVGVVVLDALIGIIVVIAGIVFVFMSSQKIWIKLLTVILLPPIIIFGATFLIFSEIH